MTRSRIVAALLLIVMPGLLPADAQAPAAAEPDGWEVVLPGRTFRPRDGVATGVAAVRAAGLERAHVVIQLRGTTPALRRHELARSHAVLLLRAVPEDAWIASVPGDLDPAAPWLEEVRWLAPIAPGDKIDPRLSETEDDLWIRGEDGRWRVSVKFHDDVAFDRAESILARYGAEVEATSAPLAGRYRVRVDGTRIRELAAVDAVAVVAEPSGPFVTENDQSRHVIATDRAHPMGVSGAGVVAGIWDDGSVSTQHPDLIGRVRHGDPRGSSSGKGLEVTSHATHVAGTFVGSGSGNPLYLGHAPRVPVLWSYDFHPSPIGGHRLSPQAEMFHALRSQGVVLANNSWGPAIGWPGESFWDEPESDEADFWSFRSQTRFGSYEAETGELDRLVRQGLVLVFSSGNDAGDELPDSVDQVRERLGRIPSRWLSGALPRPDAKHEYLPGGLRRSAIGDGFYTVGPLASAKNVITVGATGIVGGIGFLASFSNRGPTRDGRVKPDLVAHGVGVFSADPDHLGYVPMSGTSMAAPAVSGAAALVIERFRQRYLRHPLPSTVKAMLVCTARDRGNRGPDFKHGWGLVDSAQAVQAIDDARAHEDRLPRTGQVDRFAFAVESFADPVRVTLVWDDPPAMPGARKTLVNRLSLKLIDPRGHEYLPWMLDARRPRNSASRGGDTGENNVVQVQVDLPREGIWQAVVTADRLRVAPQAYSLCLPPAPDFGDAPPPYPSKKKDSGAAHRISRLEWLGAATPPRKSAVPAVTVETDAMKGFDEDGVDNLPGDADGNDDGVGLPPTLTAATPFEVKVRVASTVSQQGFGPHGRYDRNDPFKRLYLNAWADWNGDGRWTASEKIVGTHADGTGTAAFDPEDFRPDGEYTPGETFEDVGPYRDSVVDRTVGYRDGIWQPGEDFEDTAGRNGTVRTFRVEPPPQLSPRVREVHFRFRLDYGEDAGRLRPPFALPAAERVAGPAKTARYGEVEDYAVPVAPAVTPVPETRIVVRARTTSGGEQSVLITLTGGVAARQPGATAVLHHRGSAPPVLDVQTVPIPESEHGGAVIEGRPIHPPPRREEAGDSEPELRFRFDLGRLDLEPAEGLEARVRSGDEVIFDQRVPVLELPPVVPRDSVDGILDVPARASPGEEVRITVVDPSAVPPGGTWTLAGVAVEEPPSGEDAAPDRVIVLPLPADWPPGKPVGATYADEWGDVRVADDAIPMEVVPGSHATEGPEGPHSHDHLLFYACRAATATSEEAAAAWRAALQAAVDANDAFARGQAAAKAGRFREAQTMMQRFMPRNEDVARFVRRAEELEGGRGECPPGVDRSGLEIPKPSQ